MSSARQGLAFVLVFIAACGGGIREMNRDRLGELQTRASFDLRCPQANLVITNLTNSASDLVRVVGVDGCGQRVTYLWNGFHSAWFLDASSTDGRPVGAAKDHPAS